MGLSRYPDHMRTRRFLSLGLILLTACGSGTPASTLHLSDEALHDLGAETYVASCAACHGSDLRGNISGPSLLSIVYEPSHHADFAFATAIKEGVRAHHWDFGAMPPLRDLNDQEIAAVTVYVRSVQESEGYDD